MPARPATTTIFYNETCSTSKKIISMINSFQLRKIFPFELRSTQNLTNVDLMNFGIENIPTIINNNMYYENEECIEFIMDLTCYHGFNKIVTSKILIEEDEQCGICIGEFEIGDVAQTYYCNHKFHKDCSDIWRKQKNCCPMCMEALP